MKLYKNIIIVLAVVTALVITLVFINSISTKENKNGNAETETNESIAVLKIEPSDVAKIIVKADNEEYVVAPKGDDWIIESDSTLRIKPSTIQSFVYSCTTIHADSVISENSVDAEKYGFNEPQGIVTVFLKNGERKIISIGDATIDGKNNYIMISDDEKIYLKSAYGVSKLLPQKRSFVNLNLLSVDTEDITSLSHVQISKQGKTDVKIESVGENVWKMTKPVYAEVNGQVLADNVLSAVAALDAKDVVEAHASSLKPYGLDTPYAEFSIGHGGKTQKVIFGDAYNEYRFAMLSGYDAGYIVSEKLLGFIDIPYVDLMSRLVHIEYIKDVKRVDITSPDGNFVMEIKGEEDRFINGVKIKKTDFSKAYQTLIGISLNSVDLEKSSARGADVTIKYTKNDGSIATVTFVSVDDRNYRAYVNGKGNSVVSKNNVKAAMDYIKQTLDSAK